MDFLPLYIYWILRGNVSSLEDSQNHPPYPSQSHNRTDNFLRLWKALSPPVEYRQQVQTDRTHDLRKPVELSQDFDLRIPSLPEESHDLRWPVIEEDSHDQRNPPPDNEPSEVFTGDSSHLQEATEESEDAVFWRHDGASVNGILSQGKALNKCLEELSKEANDGSSSKRDASLKVCGKPHRKTLPRLVGGENSEYLQWPWMVSVQKRYRGEYRHKCGAALINSLWVITAAHCVEWQPKRNLLLRLGSNDLTDDHERHPSVNRTVDRKVIHANFDPMTFENDIALLRMATAVEFQPNILPVCLPEEDGSRLVGEVAVVLGWGRVTERGVLSGTLKEVYLPVLSNQECEEMYKKTGANEKILETFLCAGTAEGGADACDGDSGGPMSILNKDGRWSLVGVVSWGKVCAAPNQPGVYTRITKYLKWIEGHTTCIV